MDAPLLKIELQRTKMDCGIAVLGMLLGYTYEEVLIVTARVAPRVLTDGMNTRQLRSVAKRLGYTTLRKRRIDLSADTGALTVVSHGWPHTHLVVLKEDLIVETDGTIWEADIFMAAYKAEPTHLLVFDKAEQ